jgi:hypothetical protein
MVVVVVVVVVGGGGGWVGEWVGGWGTAGDGCLGQVWVESGREGLARGRAMLSSLENSVTVQGKAARGLAATR